MTSPRLLKSVATKLIIDRKLGPLGGGGGGGGGGGRASPEMKPCKQTENTAKEMILCTDDKNS